jgi:TetR/AcrR family transcriptional regulator, transcriptional repressor for nem operon
MSETATEILDAAERIVQRQGFNGFSYADVAAELGITKAALHYHFASKAALGEMLVARYGSRFADALATIEADVPEAPARLEAYVALYGDVLRGERMCLCGILAAEYQTLPTSMRDAVLRFFDDNETWLEGVLERGRAAGSLGFTGPARDVARLLISGLEGAMLVARAWDEVDRFQADARRLLAGVRAGADRPTGGPTGQSSQ